MTFSTQTEFSFAVECDECGADLRADQPTDRPIVRVKPCEYCLKEAAKDAVQEHIDSDDRLGEDQ
jgi:hypothetical protein